MGGAFTCPLRGPGASLTGFQGQEGQSYRGRAIRPSDELIRPQVRRRLGRGLRPASKGRVTGRPERPGRL
nr:MAG TPA: hypothetical protein [Caudoviricetes sp.]